MEDTAARLGAVEDAVKQLCAKVSNIDSSLVQLISKLDGATLKRNSDDKDHGKPEGEDMGNTPSAIEINPKNCSTSPFLSPDGGMINLNPKASSKRKLEVEDNDIDNDIGAGGDEDEEPTKPEKGTDIESFSVSNIRFSARQFPPGLETLRDINEKEFTSKANAKSPNIKLKTPKSKSKQTNSKNTTSPRIIYDDEPTPKKTVRRRRKSQPIDDEDDEAPPTKKRKSYNKGKSEATNEKIKPEHNSDPEDEISHLTTYDDEPILKKTRTSTRQFKQTITEDEAPPTNKGKSNKRGKLDAQKEKVEQIDTEQNSDSEEEQSLLDMVKKGKTKPVKEFYDIVTNSTENISTTGKYWEHIAPDPVFYDSLPLLSPVEMQICLNVHRGNKSAELYCAQEEERQRLTVAETLCIYPDGWLSDFFMNVYLYDVQLRCSRKGGATTMILSSYFQTVVLGAHDGGFINPTGSLMKWCTELLDTFVPEDITKIEQVFIPALDTDANHWFLLVYHILNKTIYILDSMGITEQRYEFARDLIKNTSRGFRQNRTLRHLFRDSKKFRIDTIDVKRQPNGHDCGMYVIKYIECGDISAMKDVFYSTQDMRVERLKTLSKLVTSEHNKLENIKRHTVVEKVK